MTTGIAAIFVALGVAMLGWAGMQAVSAVSSRRWPTTHGTITNTNVHVGGNWRGRWYRAQIAFKYQVSGTEHIGVRAFFGDQVSWMSHYSAVQEVSRYSTGSTVEVFYDPADPSVAVLEPGVHRQLWIFGGIACVCIAVGVCAIRLGS